MEFIWRWLWTLVVANPMIVRIVEGASRRQPHFWIRFVYVGVLFSLVIASLMLGGVTGSRSLTEIAKAGTGVFALISYGQVVLVCLLAPLFMAGAISAEQSGKTFEILLTTPLSNLQIVLGSLLGRLFFVWALLLSGLPLFSVLLLFGGVPVASVFVSFIVAATAALVVGSVAVALSVTRRGGRKAVFVFVVTVAAYLVGSYLLDVYVVRGSSPAPLASQTVEPGHTPVIAGGPCQPGRTTWLTPLHPLLVLESSINTANYRVPAPESLASSSWPMRIYLGSPFLAFVLTSMALSLSLVGFSAVCLRSFGEGQAALWWKSLTSRPEPIDAPDGGGSEEAPRKHGARPARTVWTNPVAWREASTRGGGNIGFIGRGIFVVLGLGAAAACLYLLHARSLSAEGTLVMPAARFMLIIRTLIMVELAVISLIAIYMSAGAVSKEREDGTLDLILTTPITPQYYIWGKLRGLVSFLAVMISVPVVTIAMVSAYCVIGERAGWTPALLNHVRPDGAVVSSPLVFPETWLLVALVIIPFTATCVMIGMWRSIESRGVLSAVATSLAALVLFAGTLGFCGGAVAENIPFIGAILNSFSPVSGIQMMIDPWSTRGFLEEVGAGRSTLAFGALLSAAVYGTVVWGILQFIVVSFDRNIRRLSGQNA